MKILKLVLGILILTLTSIQCYSQVYTFKKKTIIGVFEAEGKTKSEIYSSINKWIPLHYNSAQSVVQLNDKEAGNIIVKGINVVIYRNALKELYPKNKYIKELNTIMFNHTIEINVKDNKYRIMYTLTDIVQDPKPYYTQELNDMIFSDMIDFTGLKQESINNYNNLIDELQKKALMGQKKRQKLEELTRPVFEELNDHIVENIKSTMLSIAKTVNSTKKDDW